MTNCESKIVGISLAATPCLDITPAVPLSGLYLDDMSPGKLPLNPAFYSSADLAEKTLLAAAAEVETKVRIALDNRLAKIHKYTEATLGFSDTYTGFALADSNYKYLVLKPKFVKGTTITISSIAIYLQSGMFDGTIYIYQNNASVYTGLISALPKTTLNLNKPIYIAYQAPTARPRDFLTTPCCGQYARHNKYIELSSGLASSLSELGMSLSYNNISHGIEVECAFDCDPFFNICSMDFKKNSFGIIYSKLMQQIARLSIGMKILSDDKVSAYSLVRRDEINNINEYLAGDIDTMIKAIPEYYSNSDCYTCSGMYIGDIEI